MSIQEPNDKPLPSPPAADNDKTFSLTDLLQPSMTLEQIKIIELALQKIKSKRDALLSKETQGGNTIPSYDWTLVAKQMAKALTSTCQKAMLSKPTANAAVAKPPVTLPTTTPPASPPPAPPCKPDDEDDKSKIKPIASEPTTEVRDGVEWVSFVYSHLRVVRRYCIRTDLEMVDIDVLDEEFKQENCVYPRAHLPRDQYQGNRWAYETECNRLGWKLAYLNKDEIAGKRGLIQRAVDSYRNRYPSMRSRRVARQEKLRKGTLRKRRPTAEGEDLQVACGTVNKIPKLYPSQDKSKPKTLTVEDHLGHKYRIRINIETVDLQTIDPHFRRANCVFPRALPISSQDIDHTLTRRHLDEARCNELAWKLAWLNPKHLVNKRLLLQRVLDLYRTKFMPDLPTRPSSRPACSALLQPPTPLTMEALAAHEQQQERLQGIHPFYCTKKDDDSDSIYTGTTDSLDFHDCFSPPSDDVDIMQPLPPAMMLLDPMPQHPTDTSLSPLVPMPSASSSTATNASALDPVDPMVQLPLPLPPMIADEYFESVLDPMASPPPQSLSCTLTTASDLMDDHLSIGSSGATSPVHRYVTQDDAFVDPLVMNHDEISAFMLPATKDLPTNVFAQQDMDWTPDVSDCRLACDVPSDLVHQLFAA
ncbi:hypothetical protein DM01DRAFT_1340869 [Hesseltinella vesiculosa]|uniref:DUF8032 domain-containing protein n=1 Tax=Hesseltinella vesiculosa TaxID=101127 RepID=A0A1X2G3X9_9FUNG|nr:hypothetical protein DM01DRAFT_1340869 [Hesseltinella vesiculosa]